MANNLRSFWRCFRVTGLFCFDRRALLRKNRVAMATQNETYLFYILVHPILRFPFPGSIIDSSTVLVSAVYFYRSLLLWLLTPVVFQGCFLSSKAFNSITPATQSKHYNWKRLQPLLEWQCGSYHCCEPPVGTTWHMVWTPTVTDPLWSDS